MKKNLAIIKAITFFSLILLASPVTGSTGNSSPVLKQLNNKIAKETNPEKKAKFFLYRARYYLKTKQFNQAEKDYNQALETDHKSWIHLERAKLLFRMKKYNLAKEDATAARDENPNLCQEADPIIEKAQIALNKNNQLENPDEIVLDREVNPYKKSRFDVARQLGLDRRSGSFLIQRKSTTGSTVKKTASSSKRKRS